MVRLKRIFVICNVILLAFGLGFGLAGSNRLNEMRLDPEVRCQIQLRQVYSGLAATVVALFGLVIFDHFNNRQAKVPETQGKTDELNSDSKSPE